MRTPTETKITKRVGNRKAYSALLERSLPLVIETEEESKHYLRLLETLLENPRPTAAETELANLVAVLIEDFEDRHYKLKRATAAETLAELMAANDLKQKDLVDIFGTQSIVSEVLNGKRSLTVDHIRRLAQRFHVSPEVFL